MIYAIVVSFLVSAFFLVVLVALGFAGFLQVFASQSRFSSV